MNRIIVDKEIKKIVRNIIKQLIEGEISNVRSAVRLAEEHSLLEIIPFRYLVNFVRDVVFCGRNKKKLNNDDIKLAFKISTFGEFDDLCAKEEIKKLFGLPKPKLTP